MSAKRFPLKFCFLVCATAIASLALSACASERGGNPAPPEILYVAPAVVEVSGELAGRQYLSVMDGSRKEMLNEAAVVVLDRPVSIVPDPDGGGAQAETIKDVREIEIANESDLDLRGLDGKRVIVKGTVAPIREMPGFHRQMSTPVEMHVMKLTVLAE